ncbi:MAG: Rrf2 family transcriptional regulator [candidate division NC10 bacterium]|nr:Rrf2 family transcriptional regulator [candidate division NC10 bacterium]
MLFTRPCQYAIRALAHLASHRGDQFCRAQEIAQAEEIPGPFLATVLQDLVRGGLVKSHKGPRGGFCLARPAERITLSQIMEAVGSLSGLSQCAIGLETCSGDMLCPLHDQWQEVRQRLMGYLEAVTVADMAAAITKKKTLAARQ